MGDVPELEKLPPEVEAELPKQVQLIRKFYFQLSEEDKKKLNSPTKQKVKKENSNATKFCYECGYNIVRAAKFCEECGTKQPEIN